MEKICHENVKKYEKLLWYLIYSPLTNWTGELFLRFGAS